MNTDLSLLHLVLGASIPVQIVMALLLLASILSWAVILAKRGALRATRRRADQFEEHFWSGGKLSELYAGLARTRSDGGIIALFRAGYDEFLRQREAGGGRDPEKALGAVQRAMRVAHLREVERLESGLALLATIGSTSPYVGLFGTVWGIMSAFIALGGVKQATIAMVAPGIAEALIATAMGLFAAIPAVIAYNFFSNEVDRLENRFVTFSDELINVLDRSLRSAAVRSGD